MISERHSNAAKKNINKANESGNNKHFGEDNIKWRGGVSKKDNYPCPLCGKKLIRQKRYSEMLCVECSNKNRKPRGSYKKNRTRSAYYWEARSIIKRSGINLTPENHVHHINGDWTDNRIENLLVTTKWEHRKKYHSPHL